MEEQSDIAQAVKSLFLKDSDSETCVDCQIDKVKWVSIQNAVFLCDNCAMQHVSKLEATVSMTKRIPIETNSESLQETANQEVQFSSDITQNWNFDELRLLTRPQAGNKQFSLFMQKYFEDEADVVLKYNSKACQFWREQLQNEVEQEPNFNVQEAREQIDKQVDGWVILDEEEEKEDFNQVDQGKQEFVQQQNILESNQPATVKMQQFFDSTTQKTKQIWNSEATNQKKAYVVEKGAQTKNYIKETFKKDNVKAKWGIMKNSVKGLFGSKQSQAETKDQMKKHTKDQYIQQESAEQHWSDQIQDLKLEDETKTEQLVSGYMAEAEIEANHQTKFQEIQYDEVQYEQEEQNNPYLEEEESFSEIHQAVIGHPMKNQEPFNEPNSPSFK